MPPWRSLWWHGAGAWRRVAQRPCLYSTGPADRTHRHADEPPTTIGRRGGRVGGRRLTKPFRRYAGAARGNGNSPRRRPSPKTAVPAHTLTYTHLRTVFIVYRIVVVIFLRINIIIYFCVVRNRFKQSSYCLFVLFSNSSKWAIFYGFTVGTYGDCADFRSSSLSPLPSNLIYNINTSIA